MNRSMTLLSALLVTLLLGTTLGARADDRRFPFNGFVWNSYGTSIGAYKNAGCFSIAARSHSGWQDVDYFYVPAENRWYRIRGAKCWVSRRGKKWCARLPGRGYFSVYPENPPKACSIR